MAAPPRTPALGRFLVVATLLLVAACSSDSSDATEVGEPSDTAGQPTRSADSTSTEPTSTDAADLAESSGPVVDEGWTRLPDPPLSGRTGAVVADFGGRLLVVGGWDFLRPPGADCATPPGEAHRDGAIFDARSGEWTSTSDAPVGFHDAASAVIGTDFYVLNPCIGQPACPDGAVLLRYRSADDEWDTLPAPADGVWYHLTAWGGDLVAYSDSDERGERPDMAFDTATETWSEIPNDPLPAVYDRQVIDVQGDLYLFGSPVETFVPDKLAAVLRADTGEWTELTSAGEQGYQVWKAGSQLYLNGHFGNANGGIYDPQTDIWSPLPDPPSSDTWRNDLAGLIDSDDSSIYEYPDGWIRDTRHDEWREIPRRPTDETTSDESVGSIGSQLVVFGGQAWPDGAEGQLLNETWIWSPPAGGLVGDVDSDSREDAPVDHSLPTIPADGQIPTGESFIFEVGTHCGVGHLGLPINDQFWTTDEASGARDWMPDEWRATHEPSDALIAMEVRVSDNGESLSATVARRTVTYRPVAEADPEFSCA